MTFSILYNGYEKGDNAYAQYAIDWSWKIKGQWARSEKSGVKWEEFPGLDEKSYKELIKEFGLEDKVNELPPEKIIKMCPAELSRLGKKNPTSYTLGDHRLASEFEN